jgi:hypothetical protein
LKNIVRLDFDLIYIFTFSIQPSDAVMLDNGYPSMVSRTSLDINSGNCYGVANSIILDTSMLNYEHTNCNEKTSSQDIYKLRSISDGVYSISLSSSSKSGTSVAVKSSKCEKKTLTKFEKNKNQTENSTTTSLLDNDLIDQINQQPQQVSSFVYSFVTLEGNIITEHYSIGFFFKFN